MLFEEQISRKPDLYPWANDFIEAMQNGFWTHREFSFASDIHQFKTELTGQEQEIIKRTLSAIGQIEVAVKKFWSRLGDNLPHPSINDLGIVMANVEVIHNAAYERLLEVLDLDHVFEENLKLDIIKGRVKYLKKYLDKVYEDDRKQYVYAITLFTLFVENVSLFSQFYIINWFNRFKNVLKDTAQQVAYTAKEELLHGLCGMKIINVLKSEYPDLFDADLNDRIYHEAQEAYNAESKIIDWMIGEYADGNLNAEILKEYIKNRINMSLEGIGFRKVFDINSELLVESSWMDEEVLGNTMTDFFNSRPVEYSKNDKSYEDLF